MTVQTSTELTIRKQETAKQRSRLYREAALAATATGHANDSRRQEIDWGARERHSEAAEILDRWKLASYYIPTGETTDLTQRLISLSYTEAQGQAAEEGTVELDNSDGQIAPLVNQPGLILFLSGAGPLGVMREFERFYVNSSTVTDLAQGTISQMIYDNLAFLVNVEQSFSYTPDKHHKGGWTASEIAEDICRTLGIPVRYVVKTTYRIRYFILRGASAYDAIAKAFTIDYRHTRKYFYITSQQGQLVIRRPRKRNSIVAIDIDENAFNAGLTRALPSKFYTSVTPQGGIPNPKTGKRESNVKIVAKAKRSEHAERVARTVAGNAKLTNAPKQLPLASSVLFGAVHYQAAVDKIGSVKDPQWTRESAQLLADELSRAVKTIEVSAPLNMFVKQGDRVFARLRFASGHVMRKELFVSSVTKMIGAQGNTMSLQLIWQQYYAFPHQDTTDVERSPNPETTAAGKGQPGSIKLEKAGGGKIVTASEYGGPSDSTAGSTGYRGDNLYQHPDSYAELSTNYSAPTSELDFAALGNLPYLQPLRITYGGVSAIARKRDVGAGGPGIAGHPRALDLWFQLAAKIGFSGLQLVKVEVPG